MWVNMYCLAERSAVLDTFSPPSHPPSLPPSLPPPPFTTCTVSISHDGCYDYLVVLPSRTPGTGLYDNLQQYNIPSPESIFDISYFATNPKPFFALARDLYPGKYAPNLVHYFVRLLQEKSVLLRNYTQNIDGLERCE